MPTIEHCPCNNAATYADCCEPLHKGVRKAETAEQLMRSRFSAYSKGQVDYLVATLHPSKRGESDRQSLLNTVENCQWLMLDVLDVSEGSATENLGFVEFVAYFKEKVIGAQRERSRFIKEDGLWFYVDGEIKKPNFPGRNEPCWCGSGKKTKKCHPAMS